MMSHVPKLRFKEFSGEWEEKKFNDVSKKIQDGTHFSPTIYDKADYLYITSKNVKNGFIDFSNISYVTEEDHKNIYKRCNVRYGDVLLTKDGTIGQACVNSLKEEFSLLSSVAFLRLNEHNNNYFLYQFIVSPKGQKEISKSIAGQALKRITLTKIKDFKAHFPSKQEQQKIASFLTSVDTKIEQLTKKEALLSSYKKGVMQKIFNKEIRFKADDGSEFCEWEEKKLGDVFNGLKGQGLSKGDIIEDGDNNCILYGELYTTYAEIIKEVISKTNSKNGVKSLKGDLLVPCSTTTTGIDLADVTALYEDNVLLGGDITILRFKKNGNSTFFAYYLTHHKKHDLAKYAQGSTIVHMYYSHFKTMIIKFPPSIEEQTKIANFLSLIDSKIEQVQKQLDSTKEFKKALLQQMFV